MHTDTVDTVDTVVVGAGVAGLTTAWNLRRAGQTVTVVDPTPGNGASHAAAGMIAAVSEVVYQHDTMQDLMVVSAAAYPEFVTELEDAVGHPVGYRATETLGIGAFTGDRDAFADLAVLQRDSGMQVDQLTTRQARKLEPALSPAISGAFLVTDDHQVNPRVLVPALIEALTAPSRSGSPQGNLVNQQVTSVLRAGEDAGKVTGVRLADGSELHSDTTVLCPGLSLAGIDGLSEAGDVRLRPVHGDILRARLRPGHPPLIDRTIRGLVDGRPVYLVPRTDGEIVIGATEREDGFDGVTLEGVHQLLRDAQVLVPGAAELELTEILARARPGTPDDLPYIGRLNGVDGVVVSTGYSRHGILLAPLGGRLTAALVTGNGTTDVPDTDRAILTATDPNRFSVRTP
ncbi:MAG TPA: glycine oxidase ThiO [Candidatus Corynebacterium avicola]|uniref:glycine oxidase n=1 Tax=Candidatus Corynebacterium avicola TaxID=2838527 RepID=A0A9D1UNE2_9CORY|nr:glycine oxidase ThiO [Candidatus Corynebacterium avicola]